MDILRQSLNVIFAVTLPISARWADITGTGRTIEAQSELNDTLLVPYGFAFAIWGPIFLGLLAYAVVQGLPRNRERAIFRDTGWVVAGGLALLSAWGLAAALPPVEASRWLTALIFVPATLLVCLATVALSRRKHELSSLEGWTVWLPVSLLAGWCSLATFLNWNQLGVHGPLGIGRQPEFVISLLTLALGLLWVVLNLRWNRGNRAYAFSVLWGLGFLAYARLYVDDLNIIIAGAAIVGFLLVLLTAVATGRRQDPVDI